LTGWSPKALAPLKISAFTMQAKKSAGGPRRKSAIVFLLMTEPTNLKF
jgi:hypothetical protein